MKALNRGMQTSALPEAVADTAVEPPSAVDDEGFVGFYRAVFPSLAGYVRGLLGDEQTAGDVAQEALVRTYARWIKVRAPQPYAYLVATNLVRAEWRRRRRDADEAFRDLSVVGDSEEAASVRDLVERLPGKLRPVVLLHYFADLPIDEVAHVLHRPTGTVKRHLHEARQLLLDALEAE
ncbi:MAG: RNA polymerase sigma factor [Actinobacteria bacterium]|nr:MAG: RNA polymerase sigma factor [Actinomycetota bacterium]